VTLNNWKTNFLPKPVQQYLFKPIVMSTAINLSQLNCAGISHLKPGSLSTICIKALLGGSGVKVVGVFTALFSVVSGYICFTLDSVQHQADSNFL
jgi:hypothetical protein